MDGVSQRNKLTERVRNVHEWAGRQFHRASEFIRSASLSAALTPVEVFEQVQASDGYFFEQFGVSTTTMSSVLESVATGDDEEQLNNFKVYSDIQDLYVEALYTIVHKVGKCQTVPDEQLLSYVQEAFEMDDIRHQQLLLRAQEEKPPVFLLNVLLLEARDLIAKDVNGFSDPFSMMGVIPSIYRKMGSPETAAAAKELFEDGEDTANSDVDCSKLPRSAAVDKRRQSGSLFQRFGGSFRLGGVGNRKKKYEARLIPAKLIKASLVQRKTLNPKWNEKFQFIVDDVNADRFHMDIWDHDDEEKSVMDAVSSLNHISGLKGLGRYFKEVTQSARADNDGCTDDFLGCVTLQIKDIPSTGIENWFTLEKRSERSEVSGQLWLSTKEERNERSDDVTTDVKQHVGLIQQFAIHEIRRSKIPVAAFSGSLPATAHSILHQHAIQGDLIELHEALCYWLAYSAMLHIGLSYTLLTTVLSRLIAKWEPLIIEKDEENMLCDSLITFDNHCRIAIIDHRRRFPAKKHTSIDLLTNLLRCFKLMRESQLFEKCFPCERYFKVTISTLLERSAESFFKEALQDARNEDACVEFLRLLNFLNSACLMFPAYTSLFKTLTGVDYASVTYVQFKRLLSEYLCSELMSENAYDLKSLLIEAVKKDDDNGRSLVLLIKIHLALNEFRIHHDPDRKNDTDADDLGYIFDKAISKWVDLVRVRAFVRVDLACQLDVSIQGTNSAVKQTSSYVDICHMIEKIIFTWERMRVSDIRARIDLTSKIIQSICKIAEYYVDHIFVHLACDGFCSDLQEFLPTALLNMFCCAINNAEQARRGLMIHSKLRLDDLNTLQYKLSGSNSDWRQKIEHELDECDHYISTQIAATIQRFTKRLDKQFKKHVFHLAWSPSACPIETAIKPLTDMLDSELTSLHRALLHKNFTRVMLSQFNAIVPLLQGCVNENPGLDTVFYQRLSDAITILVDFFHANGKGIPMETFERFSDYQNLVSALTMNQSATSHLIEQYYHSLLKEQNEATECKYGILNVRAYYNNNSQTLVVDVLGAKQVIPLDTNGLSDPFVIIELVPRIYYRQKPVMKTRIVSRSLNPIFDETFEFHISSKVPQCAMVHFIVMDHDFLRSNDFAGEAFLDLADVPGINTNVGSALRQFNLILIHPSRKGKLLLLIYT
ncbi:unnamed protein product [Thelazia callipaeda]|uniref:C2 domain-containing protein n=1 Tax=Thelazia callipaeda TaxID=103827 RepID=A0A158RC07_THECL|nr:unnamed protein product [Thelazia callipaeda]